MLVQPCYCLEQPLTSQYLGDFLHGCTYLESRPEHGHIYTMSLWPPLQVLFSVCMIYCARQILVYLWVSARRKRILSQHVFTYSLINCTAKKILQPQQLYSSHWYWYVILLDKTSAYVLTLWFPCHEIRSKSSDCELKKMVPGLVQHEWPEYQLWIHTFPSSKSIHATVTQFSAVHITHIPFTVIDAWIRLL